VATMERLITDLLAMFPLKGKEPKFNLNQYKNHQNKNKIKILFKIHRQFKIKEKFKIMN
jgi:hypothetical protein